jgi:mRNA interferase RelE/StbE/toxin YoeB
MYKLEISNRCEKIFSKLASKNPKQLQIIRNKIFQILEDPMHFKPLRKDMKNSRRVHIDNHFVLIYEIEGDVVKISDFDHHDYIYK